MNGLPLIQTNKEKDFGIIVSQDLSWTANAERRCEKAIKAFCTIKPNIAKRTNCQAKKNLFRSYIVAVKSLVPFCGKQSRWILEGTRNCYKVDTGN